MLVSMNWIKEYVDLSGFDLKKLIMQFTLSTAEVEEIFEKGSDLRDVVVGEIVSFEKHPDSKKLHILKVDGGDRIYDCVCGAPNAQLGIKVAFCKSGGRVPGGEITSCKVAGYPSEGMCCSEAELGISDENSGIMVLDNSLKNGTSLKEIFVIDDTVFEVDNKSLTNRPDLWGHYGIAREFAALTKRPLRPLALSEPSYEGNEKIPVNITRKDLVYRYSCLRISGISKNVSPVNMRIRLYYCGMRGINLLADLTNYIMLELGQPMHAFDASKVSTIGVGTPKSETVFTTLDNTERKIDEDTLLIYNNDEPVAIAGIMGGLDSEIVDNTSSVVLESANFDGISVRKSSSRLGLRTDASMRYEKILDPSITVDAIKRFVNLLSGIDSGAYVSSRLTDEYVRRYDEITLEFDKAYVDRYTGIEISDDTIVETLKLLGFGVKLDNSKFTVTVPSWRATKDVTIKADIIEEITRIYGYDNFEISTSRSSLYPVRESAVKSDRANICDILVQRYMQNEVHSYIWCDGIKYKKLGIDVEKNVTILNIPTPENGTIRNSMIPSLLTFAYENRQYAPSFGIFEIGRVVEGVGEDGTANERRKLGIVLFSKEQAEKELYLRGVEIVKYIFDQLRHQKAGFKKIAPKHSYQHPKNTSEIMINEQSLGEIFTLHPSNLAAIDKHCSVVCIQIDLDDFASIQPRQLPYKEASKFPGVDYDLSLLTNGKKYSEIEAAWMEEKIAELDSVALIDTYAMKDNLSITVRLSFVSAERTLSMEEVQHHIDTIVENLTKAGITMRMQ